MKRGRYNRPFLHITAMCVLGIGIVIAPFLANTYPIFSKTDVLKSKPAYASEQLQSITGGENIFQTDVSQKPRDKIITYTVQKGDTISTIAQKFGVSEDTVKWQNSLTDDSIAVGDQLQVLPVTGISYKVEKGDTVYSIAKKFATDAQKIVDFPFNEFANPETFTLVEGEIVVVPDGVKPEDQPTYVAKKPEYIVKGPTSVNGIPSLSSAGFSWPMLGGISQYFSWYHPGIDITDPVGTPIVAAQSGTVIGAHSGTWDGGYGNNVIIGNGAMQSLYAHMSALNVGVGDAVVAGKTVVGWVGLTGRTTGPHLHFEIRNHGSSVNPLAYLQ